MKNIPIIILLFSLFSCQGEKATESKIDSQEKVSNSVQLSDDQMKNTTIELENFGNKEISTVLHLKGKMTTSPENQISVSMPLGGYLKSTKLIPGMNVTKGQVLAVMEDQQYVQLQQEYLTKVAQMKYAQAELNRQKKLNETQASSDKVLQEAQMQHATNLVAVRALSEQLKLIGISPDRLSENSISNSVSIRSPITGFVSQVNVNVGKYVNPSDVMFELIDASQLLLKLTVFDVDLKELSVGQKVIASSNNSSNKKFNGSIQAVNYQLNADGSTVVYCSLNTSGATIVPGQYMNADIELKNHAAAVLPEIAILDFEGKKYIFLQKGKNHYKMEEVQVGSAENGFIEILNASDFKEQKVVTKGAYQLLMELNKDSE
ncbi:MAG: efflux RND transporter periplasmic adaptor subunit [Crocinitomicaceae bacterium]|nr:efflux RND transporter periplasmic adaptor subunit [Crocinitomicaceae bacterium]